MFLPNHVGDEAMLQQSGGGAAVDRVETFNDSCFNGPQVLHLAQSGKQACLLVQPRPKLVPPFSPSVQESQGKRKVAGRG